MTAKTTGAKRKPAARKPAARKPARRAPQRAAVVNEDPFAHVTDMLDDEIEEEAAEERAPVTARRAGRPADARVQRAPVRSASNRSAEREVEDPNRMRRNRRRIDASNAFSVDLSKIPSGSSYEWKSLAVKGKASDAHQINLRENGWRPVPADRHPELLPMDYKGSVIIRDEMMLMERPEYLTIEAREEDLYLAREQVQIKEAALSDAPQGQFGRQHPKLSNGIRVTNEAIRIPER